MTLKHLLQALAFLVFLLLPGIAAAADCTATLPSNTVMGRLGIGPGPCQAIPFSVLLSQINGNLQLALLGRAANSSGPVAGISATPGSSCVFSENASTIVCGQVATAGHADNSVTNAKLAQAGAATFKGNPTSSTANVQDFTVSGLASLASPSSTLDLIPIFDHVAGTIKNVTPSALTGAIGAGVSSFNSRTGAVVPTAGDYLASQVNTASGLAGGVTRTQLAKNSDIINAADFGVKCDGSTDDTAAFTQAIAVMPLGTLEVPAGICIVSKITINKSIIFKGKGWGQSTGNAGTEIRGNSASLDVISVTAGSAQIRDMLITSSIATGSRTGAGLFVSGQPNVLMVNLIIVGHANGIHITGPGNELQDVYVSFAKADGIVLDSTGALLGAVGTITRFVQSNANGGSGIVMNCTGGFGAGVQMFNTSGTVNAGAGVTVFGACNDIYLNQSGGGSNSGVGVDLSGMAGGNFAMSTSLCEQNVGACISIGSGVTSATFVNNTITGSTRGIVSAGQYITITGNTFGSNPTSAIQLVTGSAHTVLSGNVLKGANTNGIEFSGAPGSILCAATDFSTATNPRAGALPAGSVVAACPGF